MADFFEKITGSADKSIITVSSKGKEILETAKLKGEVIDTELSIQRKFNALGKKVFEMLNRGALNEEVLKKESAEISGLFSRIKELEETVKKVELEALKIKYVDTIICYKCSSQNKSNANFCMNCGYAMTAKDNVDDKFCNSCKAPVEEGAKFCTSCGRRVDLI